MVDLTTLLLVEMAVVFLLALLLVVLIIRRQQKNYRLLLDKYRQLYQAERWKPGVADTLSKPGQPMASSDAVTIFVRDITAAGKRSRAVAQKTGYCAGEESKAIE